MKPAESALYVAHSGNHAGMHALTLLEREFGRRICVLRGDDICVEKGCIVFVTTNLVRYPNRHLRLVPQHASPNTRIHEERTLLVQHMPWLASASLVVGINPIRLGGEFLTRHAQGFYEAVRNLCGYCPPRADAYSQLSPSQKRDLHIGRSQEARRQERQRTFW